MPKKHRPKLDLVPRPVRYQCSALPTEFRLHTSCLFRPAHVFIVVYSVDISIATFLFFQLMHIDAEYSPILINPLPYHGITTSPPRQSTAVLLEKVPLSTKYTYYLCTRSSTDALHPPVTLLSISDTQWGRPIVLVFASYRPVNWILNLPADLIISKVVLVSIH